MAMIAAGLMLYYLARRDHRNVDAVFDLVVFSLLIGVVAARINYFFLYRDQFASFSEIVQIWQGGLVSWGGFIAGIITFWVILKIYKEPAKPWLDMLGVAGLLSVTIGRTGSFLSGEYAGKTTTLPWAVSGVHPVTIYEAIILFVVFLTFLWLYNKHKIKKDGIYFVLIILIYSLVRFGLDFLRTDSLAWAGLTMTQLVSAVVILGAVLYLVLLMKKVKKGAGHVGF